MLRTTFKPIQLIGLVTLMTFYVSLPGPAWADGDGPDIDLPPEETHSQDAGEIDPNEDLASQRIGRASSTPVGGYGELHYNRAMPEDGGAESMLDLHRLVLFVSHQYDEQLSVYTELELEHTLAGEGKPGEATIEQAFVSYQIFDRDDPIGVFGVRAGVMLIPMGFINQWHEPPIFHGVERPRVENRIIPTTWREGGAGIYGRLGALPEVSYELYIVGGLNAQNFSASSGLRSGRQKVAEAAANGLAVTGRVQYEPTTTAVIGLSGYYGQAGPNMSEVFTADGEPADLEVPVAGVATDLRWRGSGFETRAMFAAFSIGDTKELRTLQDADGNNLGIDAAARIWGCYGEVAYDVLHVNGTSHQLLPFVRLERYDTMAAISGRNRTKADTARGATEWVFGLSYRPIRQIVFKGDVTLRTPDEASNTTFLNLGVGFMF